MCDDDDSPGHFVAEPRQQGIEIVPNQRELPLIVPVLDFVGIVINDDIGGPSGDSARRGYRINATVFFGRKVIRSRS